MGGKEIRQVGFIKENDGEGIVPDADFGAQHGEAAAAVEVAAHAPVYGFEAVEFFDPYFHFFGHVGEIDIIEWEMEQVVEYGEDTVLLKNLRVLRADAFYIRDRRV